MKAYARIFADDQNQIVATSLASEQAYLMDHYGGQYFYFDISIEESDPIDSAFVMNRVSFRGNAFFYLEQRIGTRQEIEDAKDS